MLRRSLLAMAAVVLVLVVAYIFNIEARSFIQKTITFSTIKFSNIDKNVYVDDLVVNGDDSRDAAYGAYGELIVEYQGHNLTGRQVFTMNVDNSIYVMLGTPFIMTYDFQNPAKLVVGNKYRFASMGWSKTDTYIDTRGHVLSYRDYMNVFPVNVPDRHINLSDLSIADAMQRRKVTYKGDGILSFVDRDNLRAYIQVESDRQLRVTTPSACGEGQVADTTLGIGNVYSIYYVEYLGNSVFELWLSRDCP